ncbi:MAG: AMP-binding protein, partial [Gammaproteobacteria bacterium]|nr:AMP-binding protein [Gammaproteobacteria bacterium]
GGAKLEEETAFNLRVLGFEVLEGFGMTEAAPMITFTRPGEVLIGSAGRPMSSNEVKVVAKTWFTLLGLDDDALSGCLSLSATMK